MEFSGRVRLWLGEWREKLRRKWWFWLLAIPVGLLQDRYESRINLWIDAEMERQENSAMALKALSYLVSNFDALMLGLLTLVATVLFVVAFIETRGKRDVQSRNATGVSTGVSSTPPSVLAPSQHAGRAKAIPPATVLLAAECAVLTKEYKQMFSSQPDLVRFPLRKASYPLYGQIWSQTHVQMAILKDRVMNLAVATSNLWSQMGWDQDGAKLELKPDLHVFDLILAIENQYERLVRNTTLIDSNERLRPHPQLKQEETDTGIVVWLLNSTGRPLGECSLSLTNLKRFSQDDLKFTSQHFSTMLVIPAQRIAFGEESKHCTLITVGGAQYQYLTIDDASGRLGAKTITQAGTWKADLVITYASGHYPEELFFEWSPGRKPLLAEDPRRKG